MGVIFKNNVMYGAGDIEISPVCYSEEEREVGCWVDGKPLYQKSFTGTWNVGNAWLDTDVIIPNGWAIKAEAVVYENDGNAIQVLSNISPTGHVFLFSLRTGTTYTVNYFTMWYTKTTDTPGSGIWTPSGIPAVHYSTDEQVVGTDENGDNVYEKTFSGTVSSSAYIIPNTSGVATIKSVDGYMSDASYDYCLPYHDASDYAVIRLHKSVGVEIATSSYFQSTANVYIVTLQYTKTTS